MLVVGSVAMHKHGIITRKPGDVDIIATFSEVDVFRENFAGHILVDEVIQHPVWSKRHILVNDTHYEFELSSVGSSAEQLVDIVYANNLHTDGMANLDVLLTIKLSHRYKKNSKFFKKTLDDIIALRSHGATVPSVLESWLKRRENETYTNKSPKLNQSKRDFFDTPGVTYKYDHDSIHRAVARFEEPCYNYFKADKAEVFCSKDKFFSASEEVRLGSVVEESLVLALERCLIPYSFNTQPKIAFLMALEKVCTSISSGWWREYAYDNYYKAVSLFETEYKDFVDKFMDGLYNGTIQKHETTEEVEVA